MAAIVSLTTAIVLTPGVASALSVGPVTDTTVPPDEYTSGMQGDPWTQGDPGWDNVTDPTSIPTESGNVISQNHVYLGDGWVLSAAHVGVHTVRFGPTLGDLYDPVPNQGFYVKNPTGVSGVSSENADLYMFRINGDPGLPSLTLASSSPSINDEVMFIGHGITRGDDLLQWDLNTATNPDSWTEVTPSLGDYQGYKLKPATPRTKRWGTNLIVDPEDHLDPSETIDSVHGVLTLQSRDTVSLITTFDENGTDYEAQAVGGNSGTSVFIKNGAQWELLGIVNANLIYDTQVVPEFGQNLGNVWSVYGNGTTFADLSFYNQSYTGSISDIIASNPEYSIIGDLDLDGDVDDDDITAFVAGWGSDNTLGDGSMSTWMSGDMNDDGTTDLFDFLLMRDSVPSGAGAALALALGLPAPAIPEPCSLLLAAIGTFLLALRFRRTRNL